MALSVLDSTHPEFLLTLQVSGHISIPSLAFSLACPSFTLLTSDFAILGSGMSSRSFARLSVSMSMPDLLHPDILPMLQSLARTGSSALTLGMACIGFVFFLPILDLTHTRLFLASRSPACLKTSTSVSDLLHLGISLPLRSSTQLGFPFSVFGIACLALALSAIDLAHLGLPASLRVFSCTDVSLLTMDLLHSGTSLLSRSSSHMGLLSSAFGIG